MTGFISCPYILRGPEGGAALAGGESNVVAIDFTYDTDVNRQMFVKDTTTAANNFYGSPENKVSYTSPSVKWTLRADGLLAATSGSAEFPYEWDVSGDPLGVLIEEQRTNVCLRSQEIDDASWTKTGATISTNAVVAPDGATTADTIVESVGGTFHRAQRSATITADTIYTFSAFAKAAGRPNLEINFADDATGGNGVFMVADLGLETVTSSGTFGSGVTFTSATITAYPDSWYRLTVTGQLASGITAARPVIGLCNSSGNNQYSGDGSSGASFWGCQLEAGVFETSLIVTTSASVTRVADDLSLPTSLFNHSATAGTLYAKFRPINVSAIRFALAMDDGTANERFAIGSSAAGAGLFTVVDGGAAQTAPLTTGTITANASNKDAASWAANDFALSVNGGAAATDVSGTLPTVTSLRFGTAASAVSILNGHLEQVVHLPRTMTDAELQAKST